MNPRKSRRQFLGESSCAAVGTISTVSSLLNLSMANKAAAAALNPGEDCKTIVCILLGGGNDSFNFLVRNDATGYAEYAASRTNLAIPKNELDPQQLDEIAPQPGRSLALHPACGKLAQMFNGTGPHFSSIGRRLSLVANIGTLVEPTSLAEYGTAGHPLPASLFSHRDQVIQWQTSVPQGMRELTGWAGRMADVLHSDLNGDATSMSISLAGNNTFQIGDETVQFAITKDGALLPSGAFPGNLGSNSESSRKNVALDSLASQTYHNLMQDALAKHTRTSIDIQADFGTKYDSVDDSAVAGFFASNNFAQRLRSAVRTIRIRDLLGLRRSTIYIERGNWDMHGELLNSHQNLLTEISDALYAFQRALDFYGLQDDVITYTASDFGRTLRSNGRGTDHAWGGNTMVMGGPVAAGRVYGTFPSTVIGGPDDVGFGGRMLPTTSTDTFFYEMAQWFGVDPSIGDEDDAMRRILPNIHRFGSSTLGFIA